MKARTILHVAFLLTGAMPLVSPFPNLANKKPRLPSESKISNSGAPFTHTIKRSARDAHLEQFAPAASGLFGNMITPASILCGAIIPLCFASGLDFEGPEDEAKLPKGV